MHIKKTSIGRGIWLSFMMHSFGTLPAANNWGPFEVRHSNGTLTSNNA